MGIETSWFRGREPDEKRTDIDFGALDSWSLRGSWTQRPWSAQLSGARVNEPDPLIPGDMTRLMASVGHTRSGAISTAVFAAWGHNRESHGNSNGICSRATSRGSIRTIYTRASSWSRRSCRTRTADFYSPCTSL